MKKAIKIAVTAAIVLSSTGAIAQGVAYGEQYGQTLNAGIGLGYYGYIRGASPALHINYEFDVARNFTVAPFITAFTYKDSRGWGDLGHPFRSYSYRETVVPIGAKGSYYFDELLGANSKWDFYLAASAGFEFQKTVWESGYKGEKDINGRASGLYFDGHIGAEYHLSSNTGLQVDLSSGVSTIGVALHM